MNAYELAKKQYAAFGIDTDAAMAAVAEIPVSIHCWQGDDVSGFEASEEALSGGIQATGNYPGKARTPEELMADFDQVLALTPGAKKINLHAIYAITDGETVERDKLEPRHFDAWIAYAKERGIGIDFNPTFFSSPKVKNGLTLSSPDEETRAYWVRHGKACRKISAYIGEQLGIPCLCNIWIPDGLKEIPADRLGPRARLKRSLDEIYAVKYDPAYIIDALESKVFGIGLESYTVGSAEFYQNYCAKNGICCLLDNGHYHPTEMVSDKISSLLLFSEHVALHVTRPVRWDSDHVVLFEDELKEIAKEIVRNNATKRVLIGLDYFDASVNRVVAWTVGARNMQKALLFAHLLPAELLTSYQNEANYTRLMAVNEEFKTFPFGEIWDEYCRRQKVPVGMEWLHAAEAYEKETLSKRI